LKPLREWGNWRRSALRRAVEQLVGLRMAHRFHKGAAVAALTLMLAAGTALAGELVVAHVGPFSGPLSVNGLSNLAGAKVCVAEANAANGVNGNTLRLVDYDDGYKPENTIALMREVAARDKPVAFI